MKRPDTFRQFQLTRQLTDTESLGQSDHDNNEVCFSYYGETYICIHSVDDLNGKCGQFILILGNAIYEDCDLTTLERMLFDYITDFGTGIQ